MSKDNLKVGTITANYNNGKYLSECIDGLVKQTRKPNICTIIDDGSTDDSAMKIVQKLYEINPSYFVTEELNGFNKISVIAADIEFIAILLKKNGGPAVARNVGLDLLMDKVDAICIADSDDVLYPEKINKSIEIMKKFPQTALVYSDYDIYTEKTKELKREYKEVYNFKRLCEDCIVSNNSVIATSVLKIVGKYDEQLFGPEDYDLWLRISEVAAVHHIPEALYKYRISGNNITITTPTERFAQHVEIVHQKAIKRQRGGK